MARAFDTKFSRDIQVRWILAICILAFLLLLDASLIAKAIKQIESDASAINYSSKQRMLLERSSVIARLLVKSEGTEEVDNLRHLLIRASEVMEDHHQVLMQKTEEQGVLSKETAAEFRNLFFEDPVFLDRNMREYLLKLRDLAQTPPESLVLDNQALLFILQTAQKGHMLAALETLERQFQSESNLRIRGLMRGGQLLLAANLLIILLIALFIFRPMARRVEEKTRSLESANRMLERHAQDLEKSRQAAVNIMRDAEDARRAAEQSQERLQMVIDFAPNAILMVDPHGKITLVNSMAESLTRRSREELSEIPYHALFPERYHGILSKLVEDSLKDGKQMIYMEEDFCVMRREGGTVFVEARLSPIHMKDGSFVLISIVDMTERKKAEQLRASEERFRGVIEQAGEALFLSDDSGRLAEVNQRACESLGYSRAELLGMNITGIDIVFDRESYKSLFERLRGSKPVTLERIFQRKDTSTFSVEIHCGMIELHSRQYLLSLARDITERKRAENELREMSLALANAVEGISRYDEHGLCTMANKSFLDMFGFDAEEAKGITLARTVFRDDKKDFDVTYQFMLHGGKGEIELRAMRKDGSIFNNQMVMIKTYDEKNRFTGYYCFMKDITERKYRESLDIKSELISMVAHELRTPLHSVREGISVMLEGLTGDINPEQTDILVTTKSSVDRLVRLVNSVLDFQRLEAGIVEFRLEENNINDIIREAVKTTESLARNKSLTYEVQLADNPPSVICDRDRITQVLVNLINNAVKFTSEGKILVRSLVQGDLMRIAIEDTGIGIKREDIPKLFRKFGQLESGKIAAPGGTGLGLVISSRIIREHHSELMVESVYNEGSSFSFTLPTVDQHVRAGLKTHHVMKP